MAKLSKHAEVLDQLHTMVKKQAAEAQKNISGAPGEVKAVSVGNEHESYNKNSVGPENVPQSYSQKPSEDPSEPLAGAKTANDLGAEILDIIRKQAEAQDKVTGAPGDVKSESVGDDQEKTDKNAVKPENNKQDYSQKGSTDASKPLASAKKAEVEELAAKVASYELGRQFCAALLKSAGERFEPNETELMKQAGRRDFDLLISQAAEQLENGSHEKQASLQQQSEKQAELAGAAYFDEVLKQAALEEVYTQNQHLSAKVAQYEEFIKQAQHEYASESAAFSAQQQQVKLAESVADIVLNKLKTEMVTAQ